MRTDQGEEAATVHPIIVVSLIGLAAGTMGTAAGGLLACLVRPGQRLVGMVLGFAAGIMLAVLSLDLIPEAIDAGGPVIGIAGFILGTVLIVGLDRVLPHAHAFGSNPEASRYLRASLVIGLGIAMHNLPEGLAIGAAFVHDPTLGLAVAVAIAIHNIPEGMSMGLPMRLAGYSPVRVAGATFLAGLPMGVGATLGAALGGVSPGFLSLSLGFAAGAMLFVTCDELIPSANRLASGHRAAIGTAAGYLAGLLILTALGG